jgi:hypothetical protein
MSNDAISVDLVGAAVALAASLGRAGVLWTDPFTIGFRPSE